MLVGRSSGRSRGRSSSSSRPPSSVPLGEVVAIRRRLIHKIFLSEGALDQAYLLTGESRVRGEEGGGAIVV